ncbi:hypothetical protein BGX24_005146 [Mortierella sp. AD032]|nr:hypothetical protein BGX24_005146 [Mortierella sp. AD032]
MSEGHPAGYMSPTSMSPISPPPERMSDMHYRDEYRDTKEESPSSVTHPSPFANGNHPKSSSTSNNRHSTSWSSFGLKAEEMDTPVVPRERPSSAYYASTTKNRRSYDEAQYDEHQQLMRDNFNMETRLVISEEEPRPESAIDLLAFAAAYVQESEEHKKDGSKDNEDKREMASQLNTSNKRQRSSSTAASGIMNHALPPSSMTPVLPPILSEGNSGSSNGNNRLLSPVMVPSPQFGSSRLSRQDSSQSNGDNMNNHSVNNRESPGSDSYSRDSMNDSHASRDEEMEEIREEAEMVDESMQRAAKRRSGTFNTVFSYGVGAQ